MDGANIEIREQVGEDNIFIFGLLAEEVEELRRCGYNPREYYQKSVELKRVMDLISSGFFSPEEPHLFNPIFDSLLNHGDRYMVMADFDDYLECQSKIENLYANNQSVWTQKSILNVANMGKFSSDRAIQEYAEDIWKVNPSEVVLRERKI
jgi:starch phosphorylase